MAIADDFFIRAGVRGRRRRTAFCRSVRKRAHSVALADAKRRSAQCGPGRPVVGVRAGPPSGRDTDYIRLSDRNLFIYIYQ